MAETSERSAPSLVGDLLHHVNELVRKEVQLLRAELGEKARQAAAAGGMIVTALVIALTALNVLAAALVAAIANLGLGAGWSALIVGVVLAVVAFALIAKGLKDLKASNLAPDRTARALGKDATLAKEKLT